MKTDAVILAALPKERQAVIDVIEAHYPHSGEDLVFGGRPYRVYRLDALVIAVPQPMGMGQTHAALATADMLSDLTTKVVVLSGIAGCMGDRPRTGELPRFLLGDIIVSDSIIDYTLEKDKEQIIEDGNGVNLPVRKLEPRPSFFPASTPLVNAVKYRWASVSDGHTDRQTDGKWGGADIERPLLKEEEGISGLSSDYKPAVHLGAVLSGNSVMASGLGKRELLNLVNIKPEPIAIEMEAAGVVRRLIREPANHRPEFVMVKAFCDWAEGTKNDAMQAYCSRISALYALHLILDEKDRLLCRSQTDFKPKSELDEKTKYVLSCFMASIDLKSQALREMAEAVRAMAVNEIGNIGTAAIKIDLGINEQFLNRAEPHFRNACDIKAISIDTVSTFWTDPASREDAKRYLKCQWRNDKKQVARIFVFSSPESAHYHGKVLDAHCKAYDHVFVCSISHYRRLLHDVIAPGKTETYLKRDFALLEYPDQSAYLAALDHRFLRLNPLQTSAGEWAVQSEPTKNLFEALISDVKPGVFDEGFGILGWIRGLWCHTDWSAKLRQMFEAPSTNAFPSQMLETPTTDVFHTISFDLTYEKYKEIKPILASIKYKLLPGNGSSPSLGERYNIKDIRLTTRINYRKEAPPRDPVTNGRIRTASSRSRPYMLLMHFGSRKDLNDFYSDIQHAQIRRQLYEEIDPRTITLFHQLHNMITKNMDRKRIEDRYEIIEDAVAHKIRRQDYTEDDMIDYLVSREPYNFLV